MASQTLIKLTTKLVLITLLLCLQYDMQTSEAATSLAAECSTSLQAVTSCLAFATGKAPVPTKECCNAVSSMKDKQPVCLCFFIGQAHNGSEQIKSLGIQEAKLIELPTACQLTNASIANCPKLLGISPSSPAAAIFLHNNSTSPAGATSSASTAAPGGDKSIGFKHEYGLLGAILAIFASTFLCGPSNGVLKIF